MKNACINAYITDAWIRMICDMNETPHLVVNLQATVRGFSVPMDYVGDDGTITLNVAPEAVENFVLDKESGYLTFEARFQGTPVSLSVPTEAIHTIYSREGSFATMLGGELTFYYTDEPSVEAFHEPADTAIAPPTLAAFVPEPPTAVESTGVPTQLGIPLSPKRAHLRVVK